MIHLFFKKCGFIKMFLKRFYCPGFSQALLQQQMQFMSLNIEDEITNS